MKSGSSFLRDLARVTLPNRGECGMFAMLEFYMDDSGTHDGSRVVVWGGVVGYAEHMNGLESQWKARLANPCEGKPPIKAFHSSHLAAGKGEFSGYSRAEIEATRINFRQIILDAGVTVLSFGISVDDWDEIVTGRARAVLGSAERLILGQAVRAGCESARVEGQPISFQFDKGRWSSDLGSIIRPAIEAAEIDSDSVSYGCSPVKDNMALQAADLVAHATYQFLVARLGDMAVEPNAHLKQLFDGAHDAQARWVGRDQILAMTEKMKPVIDSMMGPGDEVAE